MKVRIAELATGYWQATFEGEEADAVIDRSPDQALASLVRANIRRLGIEEIAYVTEAGPPSESSIPFGQGQTIFPPGSKPPDRKQRGRPGRDDEGNDDQAPLETGRA